MHAPTVYIAQGTCSVLVAYDIGLAIDLAACERLLTAMPERAAIRPTPRPSPYMAYRPAPLHLTQEGGALPLGAYSSAPQVEGMLYDFGALSLTYHIPLPGPLRGLLALSEALYDNALLLQDARQRAAQLLATVQDTVQRPHIAEYAEAYVLFHIAACTTPCRGEEFCITSAHDLAQVLRAAPGPLSAQEIQEALSHRMMHGADDLLVIDWHAAFLYGPEADDIRAVLAFANVELLETRYLDAQLDVALDQAYAALSRRPERWRLLPGATSVDLQRIAQMQVENAMLFEGVNNALKLLGDQYLARVYRLASQRFYLAEWDTSILRKLHTLDSIYTKLADRATHRRMETLEWIVIVLIAVEILLPFLLRMPPQ